MKQNKSVQDIPEVQCPRSNKARMICISTECKNCSFRCLESECQLCEQHHLTCQFYRLDSLLQKVKSKRKTLTLDIQETFRAVQRVYEEAIEKLSTDKDKMMTRMQFFGLNQFEAQFVKRIIDGNSLQIKGNLSAEVFNKLSSRLEVSATKEDINKHWQRKQHQFNDLFSRFQHFTEGKGGKIDSKIVNNTIVIEDFFSEDVSELRLLYRASQNEYSANKFHQKCDGIAKTLVLARTQFGKTIGGYNENPWSSIVGFQIDIERKCFLFSVTNNQRYQLTVLANSAYNQRAWGPTFGHGYDFYIGNDSHIADNSSQFKLGMTYRAPKSLTKAQVYKRFSGSGQDGFAKVLQWEVFEVIFKK